MSCAPALGWFSFKVLRTKYEHSTCHFCSQPTECQGHHACPHKLQKRSLQIQILNHSLLSENNCKGSSTISFGDEIYHHHPRTTNINAWLRFLDIVWMMTSQISDTNTTHAYRKSGTKMLLYPISLA